ncbi:uncharacterized protein LOC26528014 [Drosophila mojavensis]|uniref:WAP domain-containing protein n=1 Tax=Drosophila mojavensis TaxID=7230 RepID=A0A0Q9X986_DROMO|nr:uncharacterized protein LOC26528014 [Drosophila mojavensis]KRG01031.1 uncharacterized protein Dmoj_GI26373 [Drosophila mojavensis]
MELSGRTLFLALLLCTCLTIALSQPMPYERRTLKNSRGLVKKNERPTMKKIEVMATKADIPRFLRIKLMDNCLGTGRDCSRSEECCSQQCLTLAKKCVFKVPREVRETS